MLIVLYAILGRGFLKYSLKLNQPFFVLLKRLTFRVRLIQVLIRSQNSKIINSHLKFLIVCV